ncbi:MAG: hypothetical protein ACK4YP_12745 [Myxococcota bacterium]
MRKHLRAAAVMVGVMASGAAWARDDGERRDADPAVLPAPVAERLKESFPAATVAEVSRWGGGWEATLVEGFRSHEVLMDAVGNIVERHVPVAVRELPEPVLATLERTHPRHTLWRATRIESDAGVFHEVLLARGDRRSAVVLDPDARVLAGLKG